MTINNAIILKEFKTHPGFQFMKQVGGLIKKENHNHV